MPGEAEKRRAELDSHHDALVKLAEETGRGYEEVVMLAIELCDSILREENVRAH